MIKDIRLIGYGRDNCAPDKQAVCTIPDFYMIHFIESGSGYFNGIKLTEGQGFICKKDTLCNYFPDKNNPWAYSWINVKGSGADSLIKSLPLKNDTFLWNTVKTASLIKRIKEYKYNPLSEELAAISALYGIFAEMISTKTPPRRDYVEEAKIIFESRFAEGVTIEQVAKKLNISRAYLRNIFYEKVGKSPQSYLVELRLSRAISLLKDNYSITEVAAAVGYSDPLQFSKMFSKHYGVCPTKYKNK